MKQECHLGHTKEQFQRNEIHDTRLYEERCEERRAAITGSVNSDREEKFKIGR